jgi:hypothetical protein
MNTTAVLGLALLQRDSGALGGLFGLVIIVAIYAYVAICLQKMAEKTNTGDTWWAWVPILNILLLLKIGQKPLWWIILFFIPLVNFIIFILVGMAVCKALNKPPLLGIALALPLLNLILLGYLAFTD